MNILVVSQYYAPENFRVNDITTTLQNKGHSITVLTGQPNYPGGEIFPGYGKVQKEVMNGIPVYRCKLYPRKKGNRNLFLNYISFAFFGSRLAKSSTIQNLSFDRVLVFQYSPVTIIWPAVAYNKRAKRPIPLHVYCFDLWPESLVSGGIKKGSIVYRWMHKVSKHLYSQADKIYITSKGFREYFQKEFQIEKNVYDLPIYAEDQFVAPGMTESREHGNNDDGGDVFRLLFAGNIGEMQSVETILLAANYLKEQGFSNVHFDIVGDGSRYAHCLQMKEDWNLSNVSFHGRHPLETMPEFYEKADGFLVTLKNDPQISYTLPGKVQTYMAFGKPILGAIGGETKEVIENSLSGLIASPENWKQLAQNIITLSQEKEKRLEYGANARRYYEQYFSKEQFFDTLTELLT